MSADYNSIDGIMEVPISDGKTVKLRRQIRNRVKAKFEDWLELRARKRVFDMKRDLNAEEFRESMDAVARISAVQLVWGGPVMSQAIQTQPGLVKLMHLLAEDAGDTISISEVLRLMTQDKESAESLRSAIEAIIQENVAANFLQPPDRDNLET